MTYVMKELRPVPQARNSPETIQSRITWVQDMMQNRPVNRANIIFVDETGYNLHIRRRRGRARVGEVAWIETPTQRGGNISVCAAMNENGLLLSEAILGPYNKVSFGLFLQRLFHFMDVHLPAGEKWIVMDNCSFHKNNDVKILIEGYPESPTGRKQVQLPPYSPFLNPIETLFSKWKAIVKSCRPNEQQTLLMSIQSAINRISQSDCQGWCRFAESYYPRCLRGEVIAH